MQPPIENLWPLLAQWEWLYQVFGLCFYKRDFLWKAVDEFSIGGNNGLRL